MAVAWLSAVHGPTAVSSRGLGHSPLKAGTRVRIPLPLLVLGRATDGVGCGLLQCTPRIPIPHSASRILKHGPIVYRLGRHPFKVQRRVRLPFGLSGCESTGSWVGETAEQWFEAEKKPREERAEQSQELRPGR